MSRSGASADRVADETEIPGSDALRDVVRAVMDVPGIESAAVFISRGASGELELAAADGVAGPALERLIEAVRNPGHPIARTMAEGVASFDAVPSAPGGPALRTHIPLVIGENDPSGRRVIGVLALAHERRLDGDGRAALQALALGAALALAGGRAAG
jgi:hypothetical protein